MSDTTAKQPQLHTPCLSSCSLLWLLPPTGDPVDWLHPPQHLCRPPLRYRLQQGLPDHHQLQELQEDKDQLMN